MQKGNIGATTENIFPVIKKIMYSDHEIFLRELVSNAVDATQKLKTYASKGDFKGELGDITVRVNLDKEAGTITISDRGIGMTAEECRKLINENYSYYSTEKKPDGNEYDLMTWAEYGSLQFVYGNDGTLKEWEEYLIYETGE
jgi:hypothetical protein